MQRTLVSGQAVDHSFKGRVWPIACPETSVTSYQYTLRNIPEERGYHSHCGGGLKARHRIGVSDASGGHDDTYQSVRRHNRVTVVRFLARTWERMWGQLASCSVGTTWVGRLGPQDHHSPPSDAGVTITWSCASTTPYWLILTRRHIPGARNLQLFMVSAFLSTARHIWLDLPPYASNGHGSEQYCTNSHVVMHDGRNAARLGGTC
jgi:hypothetical protein